MSKIIDNEKEKEMSQDSKKKIIMGVSIASVVAITFLAIVAVGMFRDFDAQKYVRSILNQTFKGEIEETVTMVDMETEELMKQYEEGVRAFVENNITTGVEMEEDVKEKYVALCKEIFASMKYEAKEAEKISRKEYRVPVEYQTTDIFAKFTTALAAESARLKDKANKGEYQGETQEEINLQMQNEFLTNSYELLKTAATEAAYSEPETMVFVVKMDKNDLFTMEEGQIIEFITKIMGLDEIQD